MSTACYRQSITEWKRATSALDEQTANAVESSILSLEDITCISVTHRLSRENMKKYSAVLKMDNGELHEDVL